MKNISRRLLRVLAAVLALSNAWVAPAIAESYSALVATENAPVYTDAALTKKIGTLQQLTVVTVGAAKNGIAAVKINGRVCYMPSSSLTAVDDVAIPATVTSNTYVYAEPSTDARSVKLKAGVTVNVLATDDDWAMIEKNGHLGYAYTSYLSSAESEETTAATTSTSSATTTADPFLPSEEVQDAAEAVGVTVSKVTAMVNVSSLPVYKSASTSSSRLGTLSYGQMITVYAYNSDWAYIGLDGNFGFCALAGLKKAGSSGNTGINESIPAIVKSGGAKVYQSASTSSKSLGTLKAGTEVNVVKYNSSWAYIELSGNYGYCKLSALQQKSNSNSSSTTEPKGTCTVITATAEMTTSNGSKVTLKAGDTMNYYGYDSKRVLVSYNGTYGYVARSSLNAASYAELTDGDSGSSVAQLENRLLELGYLDSIPSINFSSATSEAIKRFQAACGMTQTGKADVGLQRLLYSSNAPASPLLSLSLSSGSSDTSNIIRIQTRLYALGYLSKTASVDGQYGTTTAKAIALFQKTAGGTASGTANNATIRALYSSAAPSLPTGCTAADYTSSSSSSSSGSSTTVSGMPSGLASTTSSYSSGMSNAQKLEYVIYVAQQQLGKKYVYGSSGTATFDCSGLTMYCFKQIGISLAHSAYSVGYSDKYTKISGTSSLRRGDLVFFNTVSDGDMCDHTGIYLGSNYFIHASSGAGKVVVSNLGSGYYNRVYSWGRRVLNT